jgi:predicted heme/steroid binding protein
MEEETFTRAQLAQFKGEKGQPAYVALNGKVYDLTSSSSWDEGLHYDEHSAGADLTEAMAEAPHGDEELEGFSVVGRLID